MPIVAEVNAAHKNRQTVDVEGFTRTNRPEDNYFATLYMGAPPGTAGAEMKELCDDKSLPQAYLVEQPAAATIPAHYHDTDQFQVFVAGEVTFGKKPVRSLSLHYAAGHPPYGPIVTKDVGAHYFTLRAHWDSGGKPMPESKHLLKPVPRRHRIAEHIGSDPAKAGRDDVLPCEDDGLGATLFGLASGESETLAMPVAGAGQYALVVSGSVFHDEVELLANSCVYRFADDAPLALAAGAQGAQVLLMQFPVHAEA